MARVSTNALVCSRLGHICIIRQGPHKLPACGLLAADRGHCHGPGCGQPESLCAYQPHSTGAHATHCQPGHGGLSILCGPETVCTVHCTNHMQCNNDDTGVPLSATSLRKQAAGGEVLLVDWWQAALHPVDGYAHHSLQASYKCMTADINACVMYCSFRTLDVTYILYLLFPLGLCMQALYEDNTKGVFRESWLTRLLPINVTLLILILYLLFVLVS